MNEIFGTIKKESIISVFNTSLDRVRTTRKELTQLCGLSFVTVSKICDILLGQNILKQSYTTDKCASRRSRILCVKDKYLIGVFVLEPGQFKLNICDLSLRIIKTFVFYPIDQVFFDDEIKDFALFADNFIKSNFKNKIFCGLSVLVPGEYNEATDTVPSSPLRHLKYVRIKDCFEDCTLGMELKIDNLYYRYAKEQQLSMQPSDQLLLLLLNKSHNECLYIPGSCDHPLKTKNLGALPFSRVRSINDETYKYPDTVIYFSRISEIVFTLINTVGVDRVEVYGNMFSGTNADIDTVSLIVSDYIAGICMDNFMIPPTVCTAQIQELGVKNIAREIRTKWFIENVLKEDYT